MSQHGNLRRCCALSYYSYCLRLAALYLSMLFHYKGKRPSESAKTGFQTAFRVV
ncbi:hypothetical protein HMPREF9120_00095 [Neisseria sp. oral taxon 020 str. F0370]|nr:hypothetical protein HMPREF9120_00095 [Neisseria sp. oral taxon 020 str. F0370]